MARSEGEPRSDVDQIKTDLAARCAEIPREVWVRHFPDQLLLLIPLGAHNTSPLLQGEDSIEIGDGLKRVKPPKTIYTGLARSGRILELLIHYVFPDDTGITDKEYPDEVLGETSDDRYCELYSLAIEKLKLLEEREKRYQNQGQPWGVPGGFTLSGYTFPIVKR